MSKKREAVQGTRPGRSRVGSVLDGGDPEGAARQATVRGRELLGESRELLGGGTRIDGDGLAAVPALTQRVCAEQFVSSRYGMTDAQVSINIDRFISASEAFFKEQIERIPALGGASE